MKKASSVYPNQVLTATNRLKRGSTYPRGLRIRVSPKRTWREKFRCLLGVKSRHQERIFRMSASDPKRTIAAITSNLSSWTRAGVISVVLRPPLQLRFELLGKLADKC